MDSVGTLTFAIIKPHAWAAGHGGEILQTILSNDFSIVGAYLGCPGRAEAEELYAEHVGKPFYSDLVAYLTGGAVLLLALSGRDAVRRFRALLGPTDPLKAEPNTLRGRFGRNILNNAVHGSSSDEAARRELAIFFSPSGQQCCPNLHVPRRREPFRRNPD